MANAVKCGIINLGNGVMPVVCLPETGDLVVIDDLVGAYYISEITVENPIRFIASEDILERMGCKGVVICEKGKYVFYEDDYSFYDIADGSNAVFTAKYDTAAEYEGAAINYL